MLASRRLLQQVHESLPSAPPPEPLALDSDVIVILAALLCALICVVGLALVARCAWLRRASLYPPAPPNKGLKKRVLRSLPRSAFLPGSADHARLADCPICLTDFEEGEEIRVLPQCGHAYHVACIDMWLASHSSCPSCRQILSGAAAASAPMRCDKCGAASSRAPAPSAATATAVVVVPAAGSSPAPPEDGESGAKAAEQSDAHRYLP